MSRRTIARAVSLEGIGLHLGAACQLSFRPAASGAGITFCRTDLPNAPRIGALAERAVLTDRRTQLGEDPVAVHTVEHVLAAVQALEIDDLVMSMDGPEPPIMDGSAGPFFRALREAGMAEHPGCLRTARLTEAVRVEDGDSVY